MTAGAAGGNRSQGSAARCVRDSGLTGDGKVAKAVGFSLHAGVASEAHEREKLERLSLTPQGNIRYRLESPYRNGTTDVVFEPP